MSNKYVEMERAEELFYDALMFDREGKAPSKAIEAQEAREQHRVVTSSRLPKKLNDMALPDDIAWEGNEISYTREQKQQLRLENNIRYTKGIYEAMGIHIIEDYDDLFFTVQLPCGWEIKPTDHSMWNELVDNKGRIRATFFYKGAFYDRDAFINFHKRYTVTIIQNIDEPPTWLQGVLLDGDTALFETETVPPEEDYFKNHKLKDKLRSKVAEWAKQNFPEYDSPTAYWD